MLTLRDISAGTGGIILSGRPETAFPTISIDTRTLAPGDFFFSIKGSFHDGHDFLRDAREHGACGIATHRDLDDLRLFESIIMVKDTTRALQELARWVRQKHTMTIIGITGTTGKTTTKDFTAALLGKKVLKSEDNLNNRYGLPLSLIRCKGNEAFAVLEMGMSTLGEIRRLCQIASPLVGVVTNISPVHLQTLKTIRNVAQAKAELLEALPPEGLAVINGDDPWVLKIARRFRGRTLTYGFGTSNRYRAANVRILGEKGMAFTLVCGSRRHQVKAHIIGKHILSNLLAAVAVADGLGVPMKDILTRIKGLRPANLRGELIKLPGGIRLFNDAYNSNPRALQAILETLQSFPCKGRRVLLAGDMLELGEKSKAYHIDMGHMIGKGRISSLVTVGREAVLFADGARREGFAGDIHSFRDANEAGNFLRGYLARGDLLAVKGSRGMALERAIDIIRADAKEAENHV